MPPLCPIEIYFLRIQKVELASKSCQYEFGVLKKNYLFYYSKQSMINLNLLRTLFFNELNIPSIFMLMLLTFKDIIKYRLLIS